jgi:photosystem II stability/assembly factor-like uncharacterized protein
MLRRSLILLTCALVGAAASAEIPEELLSSMSYRLVGPFRGGRVTAVAGVPSQPLTFYMGGTGGGVWKTTDGGVTWRNVSDMVRPLEPQTEPQVMGEVPEQLARYGRLRPPVGGFPDVPSERRAGDAFGVGSIGAIAVAPSDENVVYVGTGSACPRGNVSPGDGIYRSTDAGTTWHHIGLPEAGQIGHISVHPADPDIAYVAVLGHIFGPNPERGVYRTTDGGISWQKILFVSDTAGAVDLAMDATNPRVLYAAFWEVERKPWDLVSGGEHSGVYRSRDGGNTWIQLTEGLPEGTTGRIGVAVSPARPNRVWALVEHEDGGLYRSDNGGDSFRKINSNRELLQRAWYYTHITAHPTDANTVYVLNVAFWRSVDGGTSFRPIRTPHGDNHALWINPKHPEIMIEGNDGGANVSMNGGRSWSTQSNQPTAEMYRVTVDEQYPYWLYGGQQDNSAVAIPSRTADGRIERHHWYAPAGCESATIAVDPRNPDITYGGCYGGSIGRFDRALGHQEQVMVWPQLAIGQAARDLRYRFQWNAPIRIDPHDPNVLYHCSHVVHRSTDEGSSWEEISPDLTRDVEAKQGLAGGPITKDNTGVEVYGTIFAFEPSPLQEGRLWAGSDDGLVHRSDDGGATWKEITPADMPEWGTVNAIELSAHSPDRAFLAVHRYRMDDFQPYIFRTTDAGASWELLTNGRNGIPADHFVRVVREDPRQQGLLYAGTELGMYLSLDDGASWQQFQLDLPVTPITDLAVHRGDLVVATQGRSYWILDDLSVLRQLDADTMEATTPHLFTPAPALRWTDGSGGRPSPGASSGQNPPFGVVIHYTLPEALDGEDATEVVLEVLDGDGEVLRTLSSQTPEPKAPSLWRRLFPELAEPSLLDARKGANRWVWNLRLADARLVEDAVVWGSAHGPMVPPGSYQVRLTVGDWSQTAPIEVRPDPRLEVDEEALEAQYELAHDVWQALDRSHQAIRTIRSVTSQTEALAERLDDDAVTKQSESIVETLNALENRINQTRSESTQDVLNFTPKLDNQLVYLLGVVESSNGRPTESSRERFVELSGQLEGVLSELDTVMREDVPELERLAEAAGAPYISIEPEVE